jgi:hypothetical protein
VFGFNPNTYVGTRAWPVSNPAQSCCVNKYIVIEIVLPEREKGIGTI